MKRTAGIILPDKERDPAEIQKERLESNIVAGRTIGDYTMRASGSVEGFYWYVKKFYPFEVIK